MRPLLRLLLPVLAAISLTVPALARTYNTVVIDPGHGGHDKGGQWGLVYEKHLTLDTSLRLENELKKRGFKTVVTRRSDYFITLPERVRITSRYSNAIFVAIHYNYTWKEDVSGLETYFTNPNSQALAENVHSSMMRKMHLINRGVKYARFFVIKNTTCPSILVECGFVSNPSERSKMKAAWYRQNLAEGIAQGVQNFCGG
jgi:N-acetylmuramoyl-L-alanine amidase